MLENKPLIVIPARYQSERLPGKLLEDIHGKPMLFWTYQRALKAGVCDIIVATDSQKIKHCMAELSIPCVLTSDACKNGTERVFEVSEKLREYNFFINVQADEPLLNPKSLKCLYSSGFTQGQFKTAISKVKTGDNISEVKVALSFNNRIRFASRAPIPKNRDFKDEYYKIHGIYSYSREILKRFVSYNPGPLEIRESVEQLRCIEYDIPLVGVETPHTEVSVDTMEDLKMMREKPRHLFELIDL